MALQVPDALRSTDINRFAVRAHQIEKAKPSVAFWAYYWIVQQIITKGLQNTDDDCRNYTGSVMDKLETAKSERPDDDAILDDMTGKAVVEQFASEVFQRAESAVRANKVTRQTVDTFQAAFTFLELLQIWPPLEPEIAAKIKFAKYHALRIAKALKAGEDPNASNPQMDADVAELPGNGPGLNTPDAQAFPAVDSGLSPSMPMDTSTEHSNLTPTPQQAGSHAGATRSLAGTPSVPSAEQFYQTSAVNGDVSPLGSSSADRKLSEGGGYFPQAPGVPTPQSQAPVAPPSDHIPRLPPAVVQGSMGETPVANRASLAGNPGTSSAEHMNATATSLDDEAIARAQKHARWAISALNFEDVPTAIAELKGALTVLGAG